MCKEIKGKRSPNIQDLNDIFSVSLGQRYSEFKSCVTVEQNL